MKFLVDAQLPVRFAKWLVGRDHDCLHTNELPAGNRTTDEQIIELADSDERVVVTTDRDFRDSHLLRGTPRRPWLISTGNITNDELHALVGAHLHLVVDALDEVAFVELEVNRLVLHR